MAKRLTEEQAAELDREIAELAARWGHVAPPHQRGPRETTGVASSTAERLAAEDR